jgi:hypothetical protein
MRKAQPFGDGTRIVDVAPGTARAATLRACPLVVELQRDANDLVPGLVQKAGDNAAVHAAGHGDNNTHLV